MYATLTSRARDEVVASMGRWVLQAHVPVPASPAEAMATIEAFGAPTARSRSRTTPDDQTQTPVTALTCEQAARATLKAFSLATGGAWYPDGDTVLLALTRQAIDGPMPTDDAVWSESARLQAVAVFLSMVWRAAEGAGAGECLLTMTDVLRARSLTLCPTWRAGAIERLLTALPGDADDLPISRYLGAALPRLRWLNETLLDRLDTDVTTEDAVADLLSSCGLGTGAVAITQSNLKVLDGKAKATLATPGKPGSNKYDRDRGPRRRLGTGRRRRMPPLRSGRLRSRRAESHGEQRG
jgi:hypothetical protein